jgi:hypothetical protein
LWTRAGDGEPGAAAKPIVTVTHCWLSRAKQPRSLGIRVCKHEDPAYVHTDRSFPHVDLAISGEDLAAVHRHIDATRREKERKDGVGRRARHGEIATG